MLEDLKNAIGYVEEVGFLGAIVGIDLQSDSFILVGDDEKAYAFPYDTVDVMKHAFSFHDVAVFDKDVLGYINGKLYMVERVAENQIKLHELNAKLESVASGRIVDINETVITQLERVFDLQGNLYELKEQLPQKPEFNIEIVKNHNGQFYTYFYACNNKEKEEIDLIKVVFIGAKLLEEDYTRETISYEEYFARLENKELTSVSPQELANYATGVMYGKAQTPVVVEDDFEEEYDEDGCDCDACCDDCCEPEVKDNEEESLW